jgi:hypothetical protein
MKLSKNSISAKLYQWFYLTNNLPNNLCPYFWKLLLMYVLIIPYFIVSLPCLISDYKEYFDSKKYYWQSFNERFFVGLAFYFILFIIFLMLTALSHIFINYTKDSLFFYFSMVGFCFWLLGIVFLIIHLITSISNKIKYRRNLINDDDDDNEKKPNIVIEFIKAKYNNYCPKIDWE